MSCDNWHTICTAIINLSYFFLEIIIKVTESQPGLHNLWQFGSRAVRKWRENEKMKRKWRDNEEMERDSLSTFPHFLEIIIKVTESQPGVHNLWQFGSRAVRKWRKNEKMKRKWRENEEMERKWKENEEMERDSLSKFPHFLYISSLSIHFLY